MRRVGAGQHLPGCRWLSAVIPTPPRHQDAVLTELATLLDTACEYLDCWYWLRYHTPAIGSHLRIRCFGHPATLNVEVLPRLGALAADLQQARVCGGLSIEPYQQEIERYGGDAALHAAEQVFAADSALALTAIARAISDDRLLLAARGAAEIAGTLCGSSGLQAICSSPLTAADRAQRAAQRPRLRDAGAAGQPPDWLARLWQRRRHSLIAYRHTLTGTEGAHRYASDLVHLHCNRLLGADPAAERVARALAADILHTHEQRR